MIYFLSMAFTAVLGLQSPASTLIGNQIGNANVIQARKYYEISVLFLILIIISEITLLWIYRLELIGIFTKDEALTQEILIIYPMFLLCIIPDYVSGMFKGILRGLGL